MKKSLAFFVRNSSVLSFSLQRTLADTLSAIALGAAGGCAAFFFGNETDIGWRSILAVQAAVGSCACFVLIRSLAPLALVALVSAFLLRGAGFLGRA